jgi:hypothetical protein
MNSILQLLQLFYSYQQQNGNIAQQNPKTENYYKQSYIRAGSDGKTSKEECKDRFQFSTTRFPNANFFIIPQFALI